MRAAFTVPAMLLLFTTGASAQTPEDLCDAALIRMEAAFQTMRSSGNGLIAHMDKVQVSKKVCVAETAKVFDEDLAKIGAMAERANQTKAVCRDADILARADRLLTLSQSQGPDKAEMRQSLAKLCRSEGKPIN